MKRRFPIVFLFIMIVGLFSLKSAFAADDDIASGSYSNWDWRITSQGELIIGSESGGTQYLRMPVDHRAPWEQYSDEVKTARFSGNVIGQDVGGLFRECSNLTSIDFARFNTSQATNMAGMFLMCSSLTSLDLSGFDTGNVTNMDSMFYDCDKLTSLNVAGFDTSNVTRMSHMFYGCRGLTGLDVSGFNTSKVTVFSGMFSDCSSLSSLDLSGFVTDDALYMGNMFSNCSSLISLDVSGFDTSNVAYINEMFAYCSSLTSLDISNFDFNSATSASDLFRNDNSLNTIKAPAHLTTYIGLPFKMYDSEGNEYEYLPQNLTSSIYLYKEVPDTPVDDIASGNFNGLDWRITSAGELIIGAENETQNLNIYDGVAPWQDYADEVKTARFNGNVVGKNLYGMFSDCQYMTSVDFTGLDTSQARNMSRMFFNCSSLTALDLSGFDTSNVTDMNSMFSDCISLASLNLSGFDTRNVTSMSFMFCNCNSLTTLNLPGFDTRNVTSMNYMFSGCSSLTTLDLSDFDTSNVTAMDFMFYGCNALTALDLSGFNTSNVTYMNTMFYGCSSLTALDLSGFNTSNVVTMDSMFHTCRSLTALNFSGFDTSNVTNMSYMFYGCSALTTLDLSGFSTGKITDIDSMFYGCSALTTLDLSGFDMSNQIRTYSMLQDCSSIKTLHAPKNVISDISLPIAMYDLEGNKYTNMPKNLTSSITLYAENPSVPSDLSVVSSVFEESESLNGQPRETMYGENFAAVAGDKVIVTLSDGNIVTFEYTVDSSGNNSWVSSSTASLAETPTVTVSFYRQGKGSLIYNTHVGDIESKDLFVSFSGTIDGATFSERKPFTTKIVDCPYRIRVGDIVYHQGAADSDGVSSALAYGFSSVSDFAGTVRFPDSITFGSGTTTNVFRFQWFHDLPKLTSIILPENTVSIDSNCFINTGLTEITIPEACENIGSYALGYVDKNTKVDGFTIRGYKGTAAETYANENGFKFIDISGEPYPDDPDDPTPEPVSITGAAVSNVVTKTYTGKAITQAPVVKLNGVTLKNGTDYTLSYKNNINAGTAATVTITGKGGYTGSITKKFTINPAVPALKLSKVTKGSKSFTAKWTKATTAVQKKFTGYQIQYSTSKDFKKKVKTQSTTQKKASKVVIRKLKKKTTYYVRIRRYLNWNGQTLYSTWSPVKKVKTK